MLSLRGRYGATVLVMLIALCPDLILSSGALPLEEVLVKDLHTSRQVLELGSSLSDAGYALGAVVAVDLVVRLRQKPTFVFGQAGVGVGALICALAGNGLTYDIGRVVSGSATGLLLVAVLPPLVTAFGADRIPRTMALVNVGLFGAAAAGPLVFAAVGDTGAWRDLFWAVAALGALGTVLTWRVIPPREALDPRQVVNVGLLGLAAVATILPFFASAELTSHEFRGAVVWAPLLVGVVALAALAVNQYRRRSPLVPLEQLSSTLPVAGTLAAIIGGGAFVVGLQVIQIWMADVAGRAPIDGIRLLWPMALGVAVAAVVFARVLRTRLLVAAVGTGLVALVGGAVLLIGLSANPHQDPRVMVAAFLLGLGAGLTVAPGLFTTALSVPAGQVARVVGVVELLRAEGAFVLGPIAAHVAMWHGPKPAELLDGLHAGAWVALSVAAAGLAGVLLVLAGGWARPQRPDLDTWLDGDEPALGSPGLGDALRA